MGIQTKTSARRKKHKRGWPRELVSMAAIRRLAREIAAKFQPEEIILFGSYAYGKPNLDSDVDLLVVMPTANETAMACRIRYATESPFPLDLIVRTPKNLARRLREEDWFLRRIMSKGVTLYGDEEGNAGMDREGGQEPRRGYHRVKADQAGE